MQVDLLAEKHALERRTTKQLQGLWPTLLMYPKVTLYRKNHELVAEIVIYSVYVKIEKWANDQMS